MEKKVNADNYDAARVLCGSGPKFAPAKTAWGMKDVSLDNDGPDDDARKPSFNKG